MTACRAIDVDHLGTERAVGAWVVDGEILVDPGPAVSLPRLLEQLGEWRARAVALTHIHLDHAGATGALLRRWPGTEVWVHPAGAPHLVDPMRLVRSARRVYGAALEKLWGAVESVPEGAIRTVGDGERRGPLDVAWTPGHAAHHVSYLHRDSRTAFVGDTAGVRIRRGGAVLVPSVPPDFEPGLWVASLERIRAWRPAALALTHFGRHPDVDEHLHLVERGLRGLMATGGRPLAVADHVATVLEAERGRAPAIAAAYEQAAQPHTFAAGIARYVVKHRL